MLPVAAIDIFSLLDRGEPPEVEDTFARFELRSARTPGCPITEVSVQLGPWGIRSEC